MVKVITLQETKEFTKFYMEQLASSLTSHELYLKTKNGDMSKKKYISLKTDKSNDSETAEEQYDHMVRKNMQEHEEQILQR